MRFRFLADPLFLVCCACYGINRWILKPSLESEFLHSWFNDLLLVPCALPVVLWLFRLLRLRPEENAPSIAELAWILAVWSTLFEWAGPGFVASATGDWMDVLMYFLGAAGAWLFWNRPSNRAIEV